MDPRRNSGKTVKAEIQKQFSGVIGGYCSYFLQIVGNRAYNALLFFKFSKKYRNGERKMCKLPEPKEHVDEYVL